MASKKKAQAMSTPAKVDDPNARYEVKLNARAVYGTSILRPRDRHVLRGYAVSAIDPQSAIASIDKLPPQREV